jgi:hypothetical protein
MNLTKQCIRRVQRLAAAPGPQRPRDAQLAVLWHNSVCNVSARGKGSVV